LIFRDVTGDLKGIDLIFWKEFMQLHGLQDSKYSNAGSFNGIIAQVRNTHADKESSVMRLHMGKLKLALVNLP